MQLPLTDEQREHLRRVRDEQLAMWRDGRPQVVDEMFVTDEVVRLMSRMGRACYLGLNGRVWAGNLGEGETPQMFDDPKDVASCIVRWASAIGLPELVEALPPMPEDGEVCSLCKGTREMPEEYIPREPDFRYFCRRCGGLGWTLQGEPSVAPDCGGDPIMADTCPHCGTVLPNFRDAFCPECRGPLAEERSQRNRRDRPLENFTHPARIVFVLSIVAVVVGTAMGLLCLAGLALLQVFR